MADIMSIIRNNPNLFANENDVCKKLCGYLKKDKEGLINLPISPQPVNVV